ncbi:MAG: ATP-binding cassette domain-containing protein [Clostridia bacterium]|nr:ATP-binding cassette domain-containing protein [Clostridia bacterium]
MADTVLYKENQNESAMISLFDSSGFIRSCTLNALTLIGNDAPDSTADIRISSPGVSKNHGQIALIDGHCFYRDLGSENGTVINKRRLDNTAVPLENGDVIKYLTESGEGVIAIFTRDLTRECRFETIPITDQTTEIRIGRSALNIDNDAVSEKHASFFKSPGGWALIDHASTNGVYLNGKRLSTPRFLNKFDVIKIAGIYFVFLEDKILYSVVLHTNSTEFSTSSSKIIESQADNSAMNSNRTETSVREPQLAASCGNNVESAVTMKRAVVNNGGETLCINIIERAVLRRFKKVQLLKDISINVAAGEMVLILGGSGAGKTTFLNAVMGYEKAKGSVHYNDTDIYSEYDTMKYEIGFVPQSDLLRGSDSVYSTLENAAHLKLSAGMKDEERLARVDEMLTEFGLQREKATLVSKLSGGQRKRLSIAVEFIARPKLFFLDEPDSGIDDIMGSGLMKDLRRIADSGTIVMVITHSPERGAGLFDKVIVLAKSSVDNCGHLAFYGTPEDAFEFFGVDSYRGIVKRINRPDENGEGLSDHYIEKYKAREEGQA